MQGRSSEEGLEQLCKGPEAVLASCLSGTGRERVPGTQGPTGQSFIPSVGWSERRLGV